MNDDIFTATVTWQPVQANGEDIMSGTFSVVNMTSSRVDFLKSDTQPAASDKGSSFMNARKDSNKYTLGPGEKLYAKAGSGTAELGVITA